MRRTLIEAWRRRAVEGMPGVFSGAEAAAADREAGPGRPRATIGRLVVERDGLREGERARRWSERARGRR